MYTRCFILPPNSASQHQLQDLLWVHYCTVLYRPATIRPHTQLHSQHWRLWPLLGITNRDLPVPTLSCGVQVWRRTSFQHWSNLLNKVWWIIILPPLSLRTPWILLFIEFWCYLINDIWYSFSVLNFSTKDQRVFIVCVLGLKYDCLIVPMYLIHFPPML